MSYKSSKVLEKEKELETKPKLIVFTAPSGAGKTTIVNHLLETNDKLAFSISACTRAKRPNEVDGKDYYFLTKEAFEDKIRNGEFLEWEEVYDGIYYGTLSSEVDRLHALGKTVLFDIDVKGAESIKKKFGDKVMVVFIKPPDMGTLISRLKKRKTENDQTFRKRIKRMEYEMTFADRFDKVIINDNLQDALHEAEKLVEDFLLS